METLKPYHTFNIDAYCEQLLVIDSLDQLLEYLNNRVDSFLILGGGSNVLFTQDFNGTVLVNKLSGIEVKRIDDHSVRLTAGGGVVWDELVDFCVSKNYYGIENLTAIPGSVGAAPMQNIGAYGVELKDVFLSLTAVNLETGKTEVFNNEDCQFGYRSSVFKTHLKNKYFITSVSLILQKNGKVNDSYTPVRDAIKQQGIETPTIADVKNIITNIRWSKLPRPSDLGNAGSFFKNPVVSNTQSEELLLTYPKMPHYHVDGGVKVPAGWLIEQCGWKGKQIGNTGSHALQSLVIVNYGGAQGSEVLQHAHTVRLSVIEKFNIPMEMEVNVY